MNNEKKNRGVPFKGLGMRVGDESIRNSKILGRIRQQLEAVRFWEQYEGSRRSGRTLKEVTRSCNRWTEK